MRRKTKIVLLSLGVVLGYGSTALHAMHHHAGRGHSACEMGRAEDGEGPWYHGPRRHHEPSHASPAQVR